MTTPELLSFIRAQFAKGSSKETVRAILGGAGWEPHDIDEAFNIIEPVHNTPPVTPVAPINSAPAFNPTISPNATVPVDNTPFLTPHVTPITQPSPVMPISSSIATPANAPVFIGGNNPNPVVHPKKSKMVPIMILVILLLLIGGSGAFAYYAGYFETPASVMSQVSKNMQASTSTKIDMTMSLKTHFNDPTKYPTSLMGFDFSNLVMQIKGSSEGKDGVDKGDFILSLNMGNIKTSMEFKILDKVLYASLLEAPTFGLADLTAYQNKWFSYKLDTPQDTSSALVPVVGTGKSLLEKLTPEEKTALYALAEKANFITELKKNGTDSLEGVATNRYTFTLDKAGILDYLIQTKNFMANLANRDSSFSVYVNYDSSVISKALDNIKNFQGEVWVGKKDKFPRKITMAFTSDIRDTDTVIGSMDVNMFILLSDWNMPVKVEVPADAQDFQALINAQLEDARTKSKDAAIKANLANSRAAAEIYWDGNGNLGYKGFCKSTGTSYSGSKILSDLNELVKPATATCKDSVKSFIFYSPVSNNQYWCVDSTGASTAKDKMPLGMMCN